MSALPPLPETFRAHGQFVMKRKMDIEQMLRWTYCEELVKGGADPFLPAWERMRKVADLGTMVDESHFSKLPPWFGDPHPDALMIAQVVDRLPHRANVLVIIHAWKGTRPEPFRGSPSVFPVRDGSKVKIVGKSYGRASNGRGRYYSEGSYCPLVYRPSLEAIQASRADWALWRSALMLLIDWLKPTLQEHIPTWANLPEAPWL